LTSSYYFSLFIKATIEIHFSLKNYLIYG